MRWIYTNKSQECLFRSSKSKAMLHHEWDALLHWEQHLWRINLWWHSWPRVFLPIFSRLSFSQMCRVDSCTLWQNGARWSGSFSSPLTTAGTHMLFTSSKIKTSAGFQRQRKWREFLFSSSHKGLSQTGQWDQCYSALIRSPQGRNSHTCCTAYM